MRAKDKAKELVEKYTNVEVLGYKEDLDKLVAIECAKIAVDEIIKETYDIYIKSIGDESAQEKFKFYHRVKNEINKM